MKLLIPSHLLLFLYACGGASDSGNTDITPSDSLVEFEINEERSTAVEFNNELSLMQQDMLDGVDNLFKADSAHVQSAHETVLFEAEINLSDLDQMELDGSEIAFVQAMKDLMTWYIQELKGPFMTIIPVLEKVQWDDNDEAILNAYDAEYAEREKEAYEPVFSAQEAFAKANNIKLENQ